MSAGAPIADIAALPGDLATAVAGLSDEQLDTPYRPGGWTVRQVVHHVADSHMNAFIRLKLALTEDRPTVSAYDEKAFAELADMRAADRRLARAAARPARALGRDLRGDDRRQIGSERSLIRSIRSR